LPTISALSWSQTIDQSRPQRLLVVAVVTAPGTVTGVKFNDQPLNQKAMARNAVVESGTDAAGVTTELWYLTDPPVGTGDIVVSLAGPVYAIGGIGAQYSGVNQTSPLGDPVSAIADPPATSVSSDVEGTISTAAQRGLVIDVVGLERLPPVGGWEAGADQKQGGFRRLCGRLAVASSEKPSNGGTVTMSGSGEADYHLAHLAVEVRPAERQVARDIFSSEVRGRHLLRTCVSSGPIERALAGGPRPRDRRVCGPPTGLPSRATS
jgi:hypothetical protein